MVKQVVLGFFLIFGLMMVSCEALASATDERFVVILDQGEATGLDIQAATALALPTLWKRVVPTLDASKIEKLPAAISLVLQFKPLKHGVKLVFNPNQVRSFLAKRGITMITNQPHWDLSVYAIGFSNSDELLSRDLLNYGHGIADKLGFKLGSRGEKLKLVFAPVTDVYGQLFAHVDVQGYFPEGSSQPTDLRLQGYTSYQLQDFLEKTLLLLRDAYRLGVAAADETSHGILLTIEADYPLASQVMLEQALIKQPAVESIVPTILKTDMLQYRIQLRDSDDSWLVSWFAAYGLSASKQPEGSVDDWLVE